MNENSKKKLEKILREIDCPKDFICYRSNFEKLCKAEDIGLESFLVCLEENPSDCNHAMSFGDSYFCSCPSRIFIAKNIKE